MEEIIIFLVCKFSGDWMKIYNFLESSEKIDLNKVKKTIENINSKYLTIIEDRYPNSFKTIYKPPFALLFYGDIAITNNSNLITLVGDANKNIEIIKKLINKGFTIALAFNEYKNYDFIYDKTMFNKIIFFTKNGIDLVKKSKYFEIINKKYLIISEIPNSDNSNQSMDYFYRLFLGISKNILLPDGINDKANFDIINFANNETYYIFAPLNHQISQEFDQSNVIFYDGIDGLTTFFNPKS